MFHSVHHAVAAMLRYQERQRSPRAAPWPDHIPGAASAADRWRYVYVHATRGAGGADVADERDALTVLVLFDRLNRHRYLTRLLIDRQSLELFAGRERRRARHALICFAQELCCRGLLESPPKGCPQNLLGKFPSCQRGSKGKRRFYLTR